MSPWLQMEMASGEISNFDFSIEPGVEDDLRAGKYCQYSAWNFCGYVWHDGERFNCEVWRHKSPVETISADTIAGLMASVSDEYGYE